MLNIYIVSLFMIILLSIGVKNVLKYLITLYEGNFILNEILSKNFIKKTYKIILGINCFLIFILVVPLDLLIYKSNIDLTSFIVLLIKISIILFPLSLFLFQSLIKQKKWLKVITQMNNFVFFINNEKCEVIGLENWSLKYSFSNNKIGFLTFDNFNNVNIYFLEK